MRGNFSACGKSSAKNWQLPRPLRKRSRKPWTASTERRKGHVGKEHQLVVEANARPSRLGRLHRRATSGAARPAE